MSRTYLVERQYRVRVLQVPGNCPIYTSAPAMTKKQLEDNNDWFDKCLSLMWGHADRIIEFKDEQSGERFLDLDSLPATREEIA